MRQKHDKAAIICEGVKILRMKGYHDTGVDDILKACQLSSGSFYNFFKSKEGFAIQALEQYNQVYQDYLDGILKHTDLSPLEKLQRLYGSSVQRHVEDSCQLGCLLNSMTSEIGTTIPAISKKIQADFQLSSDRIAKTIRAGQELGEIRIDYTAEDLADFLINGFIGASTRMKAGAKPEPLHLFLRTAFEFIKV